MAERGVNIWGKPGCELPNGGLCTACCTTLEIPELKKEAGSNCVHQMACHGCAVHATNLQPHRCRDYHCSTEKRPHVILYLTGAALLNREVTREQAVEAQHRLL